MSSMPTIIPFDKLAAIATLALALQLVALTAFGQAQQATDARALTPNQTLEREMTGMEMHRYKFDLKAKEFFQARVEQKGVDVTLKFMDASGNALATMDSPNGKEGSETLSFVAEKAGNYILEVGGLDARAKGIYILRRAASREAAANDKRRVAVEKLFVEGMTARGTEGQDETAVTKLEEAITGWRELKDEYLMQLTAQQVSQLRQAKAEAVFVEAMNLFQQGTLETYKTAGPKFLAAKELFARFDNQQRQAEALAFAGLCNRKVGDNSSALENYSAGLSLFRALKDIGWQGILLSEIGLIYSDLGERQKALDSLNQSLPLLRAVDDTGREIITLNGIGKIHSELGEKEKATEYINQALLLQQAARLKQEKLALAKQNHDEAFALSSQQTLKSYQVSLEKFLAASRLYREVGDKGGEAPALAGAGRILSLLGDSKKALEHYNQSLPLFRQVGDKRGEAQTLNNVGIVYAQLDENQKALEYYNQSLSLFRQVGDKRGEAQTLNNVGNVYSALGEKQRALEYYNQSLPVFRQVDDKLGETITLTGIGLVYSALGDKQKALEFLNQSVLLYKQIDDKNGEAITLTGIGIIYSDLGDQQKALEFYNQSLPLFRQSGDKSREAATLNSIGGAYADSGENKKALEYYNQALPLYKQVGDKSGEAVTLRSIGLAYAELGEKQRALEYYDQALQLSRQVGDTLEEATVLLNVGDAYSGLNETQKALEYLNQALPLFRRTGDKRGEAITLYNLMDGWVALNNPAVAVFYGKQSVNKYQELRQAIRGLDRNIQKTFLKSVEYNYRELADLLIEQGHFAQAEKVLAMLKEEEYFDFVRRDVGEIGKLDERVPLNEKEKALIARYSRLADRITEIGQEFIKLDDKKRQLSRSDLTLSTEERKRYEEFEKQLDTANAAFQLFLNKELVAEIGKEKKGEIEIDRNLQDKIRRWGEGTVALYTVAGEGRYRVILTTPKVQVDGKTEIKIAELNKKVFAFRAALQNPNVDPRPLGKELYDILIKPIEKQLQAANAKTLVWSLDGTLRYIPLAALSPDGKRYLVEDVQNVIITPKTRDDVSDSNSDWQALGWGVSEAQTVVNPEDKSKKILFGGLPGTERELLAIVKDEKSKDETGVLPGRRFMNSDFTINGFKDSLAKETVDGNRKYNVVHIASHFRLGSNDSNSFILLGSGQILTLEEIRNSSTIDFGSVELITLSACNTGFADDTNGKEIDSLASVIQTKSGKAVLATLWAVADESTSLLMREFYRLRKENPQLTKAAALQMAQKEMSAGRLKASVTKNERRDTSESDKTPSDYSHPYYWAPFILIGNWR